MFRALYGTHHQATKNSDETNHKQECINKFGCTSVRTCVALSVRTKRLKNLHYAIEALKLTPHQSFPLLTYLHTTILIHQLLRNPTGDVHSFFHAPLHTFTCLINQSPLHHPNQCHGLGHTHAPLRLTAFDHLVVHTYHVLSILLPNSDTTPQCTP